MPFVIIEQDKPVEASNRVEALITEFIDTEEIVVFGYGYKITSTDERQKERQRLEGIKLEIGRVIDSLGDRGVSAFSVELDRLEQEAKKGYDAEVREYCLAGQTDANLGDFYDNEVNASLTGLRRRLDSIGSVRSFLQKPLISQNPI